MTRSVNFLRLQFALFLSGLAAFARRSTRLERLAFAGLLIGLYAWAGPRPYATVNVVGTSTVSTLSLSQGAAMIMQCPSGAVYYKTLTAEEFADQDGGAHADGGFFGVKVDFSSQGDPVGILLGTNQVAIALLGTDAGTLPCYFSTP